MNTHLEPTTHRASFVLSKWSALLREQRQSNLIGLSIEAIIIPSVSSVYLSSTDQAKPPHLLLGHVGIYRCRNLHCSWHSPITITIQLLLCIDSIYWERKIPNWDRLRDVPWERFKLAINLWSLLLWIGEVLGNLFSNKNQLLNYGFNIHHWPQGPPQ